MHATEEDSDDDDVAETEELEEIGDEIGLDLDQCVTVEQWAKVMRGMCLNEDEADDMYEQVKSDIVKHGDSLEGGIPLVEFMDDLRSTARTMGRSACTRTPSTR